MFARKPSHEVKGQGMGIDQATTIDFLHKSYSQHALVFRKALSILVFKDSRYLTPHVTLT